MIRHKGIEASLPPPLPLRPSLLPYLRRRAHKQTGKPPQALQGTALSVEIERHTLSASG